MSNTYYNNDDIMQNIDKVADDVTAIKDIIINLAKDNIRFNTDQVIKKAKTKGNT